MKIAAILLAASLGFAVSAAAQSNDANPAKSTGNPAVDEGESAKNPMPGPTPRTTVAPAEPQQTDGSPKPTGQSQPQTAETREEKGGEKR